MLLCAILTYPRAHQIQGAKREHERGQELEDEDTPMPKPVHCIKDGELLVYLQNQFQTRRVAFTADNVMFSWSEGESVVDLIPMKEIVTVGKARREDWANPEDKEEIEYFDTSEKKKKRMSKFLFSHEHTPREFKISTTPDGFNSGREYIIQTDTEDECEEWIAALSESAAIARMKWEKKNRIKRFQGRLSKWFKSFHIQAFIGVMIAGNFVQEALRLQIRPDLANGQYGLRPDMERAFEMSDGFFTAFFVCELAVNLTAHWWKNFVADWWNIFDAMIVTASLVSMGPANVSFFKTMRLIRAFRIMRLFGKLRSLRQMINALTSSILPVFNAMMIVLLFHCIFAVLGVNAFSERDEEHFKTFMKGMLTLFQCATLDNWAEITRGLFGEDGSGDPDAILFFVIWLVIVSYTLLPVVVAVLLDNFWAAARREKEAAIAEKLSKIATQSETSSLDPLLNTFMTAHSMGDLVKRLQTIFRRLDTDNSGGLSHQELFEGLKKMQFNPAIKLSIEEFNRITQDRRLCNEEGEIEMRHWEGIMLGQLKQYAERMLGQSISAVTEDNDHMATLMFALQIMLRNQDFQPQDYIKRIESEELRQAHGCDDHAGGNQDGQDLTEEGKVLRGGKAIEHGLEQRLAALEAAVHSGIGSGAPPTPPAGPSAAFLHDCIGSLQDLMLACRQEEGSKEPLETLAIVAHGLARLHDKHMRMLRSLQPVLHNGGKHDGTAASIPVTAVTHTDPAVGGKPLPKSGAVGAGNGNARQASSHAHVAIRHGSPRHGSPRAMRPEMSSSSVSSPAAASVDKLERRSVSISSGGKDAAATSAAAAAVDQAQDAAHAGAKGILRSDMVFVHHR